MKALHGTCILDLTHMLSGPYAGMMLADPGTYAMKFKPTLIDEGTSRSQHADISTLD